MSKPGANQLHEMLGTALKGIDRSTYKLMTKIRWNDTTDAQKTIDRFCKELNTEYFDILLLHCLQKGNWTEELKPLMDQLGLTVEDALKDQSKLNTYFKS